MQVSRLRLVGFKSFVDPTELAIEPGLTGVVGPNGCGKSNLVEALRWVMGEKSARRVRGGEMDDVIFAGTTAKPARNIAEVALTIDNGGRDAPFAFNDRAEIEVVRRIERGIREPPSPLAYCPSPSSPSRRKRACACRVAAHRCDRGPSLAPLAGRGLG